MTGMTLSHSKADEKGLYVMLFQKSREEQLQVREYIIKPSEIADLDRLKRYDESAEEAIKEAENMIEQLKEYRRMLFERAQELETLEKKKLIEIIRSVKYDNSITYSVNVYDVVQDGKSNSNDWLHREIKGSLQKIESNNFSGKERRKAIDLFNNLKVKYPCAIIIDCSAVKK